MLPRMSVMISFCCTEPPKFWDTAVEPGVEVLSCKMVKRINYTPLPFVLGPILAVVFPLRWKSHNIKLAILKCTIQWHLEHFQCHAVHLHQVPNCFQNPKGKCHAYKAVTPPFPLPSSSWKPPICLLFYGFAYSGHFLPMESYNMESFVSDFLHLAWCVQRSSVLCISVLHFFQWLNDIPFHRYTIMFLFIHSLMEICIISTFWLLWMQFLNCMNSLITWIAWMQFLNCINWILWMQYCKWMQLSNFLKY